MANLSRLPEELLEQVCFYLTSIDDVLSLARSCKAAKDKIMPKKGYTRIMRRVIRTAYQHRFDIALCRLLDFRRITVLGNAVTNPALPFHQSGGEHQFVAFVTAGLPHNCLGSSCGLCLPDGKVDEIITRYQGLRELENMWLARQRSHEDFFPLDYSNDAEEFIAKYCVINNRNTPWQDEYISNRTSDPGVSYTKFDVDQRCRFYSAIIVVWILNEIRWISATTDVSSQRNRILEGIQDWIGNQTHSPLIETLDRYAVFRFMYHVLLPAHCSFLGDSCPKNLPMTFSSAFRRDPWHCANLLKIFLTTSQAYLQPPDIIDLVIRSQTSRRTPWPSLALPESTYSHWMAHRRSNNLAVDFNYSTCRPGNEALTIGIRHINQLLRVGFQSRSQTVRLRPVGRSLPPIPDDLCLYLKERALVEFDKHTRRTEVRDDGNVVADVRDIFTQEWAKKWWEHWWWASSDDKARAKMERWRNISQE